MKNMDTVEIHSFIVLLIDVTTINTTNSWVNSLFGRM
jgi:hypothetical protein